MMDVDVPSNGQDNYVFYDFFNATTFFHFTFYVSLCKELVYYYIHFYVSNV